MTSHARRTMASDFHADLSAALEREGQRAITVPRLNYRNALARKLRRQLDAPRTAAHLHAVAKRFRVPHVIVRDAVAIAVAVCRVRGHEARAAVLEKVRAG